MAPKIQGIETLPSQAGRAIGCAVSLGARFDVVFDDDSDTTFGGLNLLVYYLHCL